jgi:hypothetical protein
VISFEELADMPAVAEDANLGGRIADVVGSPYWPRQHRRSPRTLHAFSASGQNLDGRHATPRRSLTVDPIFIRHVLNPAMHLLIFPDPMLIDEVRPVAALDTVGCYCPLTTLQERRYAQLVAANTRGF